jgi:hypothetical protein
MNETGGLAHPRTAVRRSTRAGQRGGQQAHKWKESRQGELGPASRGVRQFQVLAPQLEREAHVASQAAAGIVICGAAKGAGV